MNRPNEVPAVTLDELFREYLGEEVVQGIDRSESWLQEVTLTTHAGDTFSLRLSRSTARKFRRALIALASSLLGYVAWDKATGQTQNAHTDSPQPQAVVCTEQNH
jgi:hypothetical protein